MRYTYAISALRAKRARLAGEIEAAERTLAARREALAALDATLRLFHPEADPEHITTIRPHVPSIHFRYREQTRFVVEALRDADKPLPTHLVSEYVMRAKGLPREDADLRGAITNQVRKALHRLAARGAVRRLVCEPEGWWELAGRGSLYQGREP